MSASPTASRDVAERALKDFAFSAADAAKIVKLYKGLATKHIEQTSSVVGLILSMGDQCYNDKERFGDTPWCKEGDFVLIGAYKGVRFNIHGKEFRLINDDTVQAVVDDPRGYSRT